ncbi:MAG: hypothetical protein JNM56_09290 [Planctomycetia bacterium]|nr:hypothetical protein [Planctomycetia bacterium]
MHFVREFNGQIIRRTIRVGDQVAVVLKSPEKGQSSQRLLLSVADYRAGLKIKRGRPASGGSHIVSPFPTACRPSGRHAAGCR